jgi:arylsulfatase A-like enzyme
MSPDQHARSMLPIPDRPAPRLITYDAKDPDTAFPAIEPLLPPKGAPNVLVILVDDVGFGASSAFGGPCQTPNAERLAAGGLRFNRFHTTALCAPTRQALLTGRNHHSVGMGSITETATSAPGMSSLRPNTKAPLAMTLKLNGYSTAQFGKCHEVPVWQSSPMGPFDAWPSGGGGFETFYGFIGGENNQHDPALYDGTTPVEPPATAEEGYHLTENLTDHAVSWMRQQKALMPDKPFFVYFAPGATHAPHHVPKEWADKYAGRFDDGWDVQRERTFAKQKELGVIPADADLTARHDEITAWDDMPEELKPVLARQMEVYAGFLEHTDHHIGRLVDAIEDLGVLENTIIYYIIGDNGASAEGTMNGAFNEMANFNGMAALETPEFMLSKMDELGSPESYNHFSVGWAWAMNNPAAVDQAGRLALGRHPQRDHRALAGGHRGAGWPALAVHPRDRPGSDDPGGGRAPRADGGQRRAAVADGGHVHALHLQRAEDPGAARPAVLRDVRQPRHLSPWLECGDQAQDTVDHGRREHAGVRRRRVGALRRQQ